MNGLIRSKGVQYMLVASFVMTIMQTCVKLVSHIPAVEVVFFRAIISVTISYVMLKKKRIPVWGNPENRKMLWMRGVLGTIALVMIFASFQNMPLGSAVLLHYLAPVFTAILASIFLKEKLFKLQWVFLLICFVGVSMIKGFDTRIDTFYFFVAIGGAIMAAAVYVCIRNLKGKESPYVVVFYFPFVAMPTTGILSYFNWVTPQGWDWLLLLIIGILTQVGQVLLTKAYQAEQAAKVASINYTGIIYGLMIGFFFFGESYNWMVYLGMFLVIFGVIGNLEVKRVLKLSK